MKHPFTLGGVYNIIHIKIDGLFGQPCWRRMFIAIIPNLWNGKFAKWLCSRDLIVRIHRRVDVTMIALRTRTRFTEYIVIFLGITIGNTHVAVVVDKIGIDVWRRIFLLGFRLDLLCDETLQIRAALGLCITPARRPRRCRPFSLWACARCRH